ncbi:MAG: PAS domain-containing protein [Candidatus Rokubacteria bacterium]|nr:PAS domain-containing protein [Candidatus Rokubacteria bacterium]
MKEKTITVKKKSWALGELVVPDSGGRNFQTDILAHIPSSILILDPSLRVTFANRNFLVKSRKEEGEVLGKRISDVFPPVILYYTDLEERLRKVCQTGRPFEGGEMEYRAPGLAARVYFYSLTPLKDQDGRVESVMLFMDDVTEKKSLGERVRQVERHLASVVQSANDPIVSLDAAGAVMTWNSAAERILGFSSQELVTRQFADLFSEADRPHLQVLVTELAREGTVQEIETGMKAKAGQELLVSWRFSAMREEGGRVVALVGVGRDLTEKRRLALQLVQSAKMAALGEMAGGIAHEIRNPLAITSSAAQILLKKGDDRDLRQECAGKIRNAANRAAAIIESLLRFSRPSAGLVERVDINSAIEDTLGLVGHQISLQSIGIQKRLAPGLPSVRGNKNQLQQVLMNLILNAYNAMPEGGRFTIESRLATNHHQEWIEVRFADTGSGIPEEHLSRIFDPFFTTMPVGKGTGLGLSIAYSIVQQHGGTIRAESEAGKGSTFTVTLPAERPDA